MYIEKIEWMDKDSREAILKVSNDKRSLMCFCCPCSYNIGDVLNEPLECLDADDIVVCETMESGIEKLEGAFMYRLRGKLKDIKAGIIEVYGFDMHIDESKIPGDVTNEMYVQFVVSRIDIW